MYIMKFTVTPTKEYHESPVSYALRLTKRNGFASLRSVFSASDIQKLVSNKLPSNAALRALMPSPRPPLGSRIPSPLFHQPVSLSPKICIACIAEKGYFTNVNQSAYIATCPEHGLPLLDTCDSCTRPLEWDVGLLSARCTFSGCQRKLFPPEDFARLVNLTAQATADCLLAGTFVRNPKQTVFQPTQFAKVEAQQKTIQMGYTLLTNAPAANEWLKESVIGDDLRVPVNVRRLPSLVLLKHLHLKQWPSIPAIEQSLSMKPDEAASVDTAPLTANCSTLMEALELTPHGIRNLQERGLAFVQSNSKVSGKTVIEITPLFESLHQCFNDGSGISLKQQLPVLVRNGFSVMDLILAAFRSELTIGYRASEDLLSSVLVAPEDLNTYALNTKNERLRNKVTLKEAQKLTGLSSVRLKTLRQQGIIRKPSWFHEKGRHFCSYKDIAALIDSKVSEQLKLNI